MIIRFSFKKLLNFLGLSLLLSLTLTLLYNIVLQNKNGEGWRSMVSPRTRVIRRLRVPTNHIRQVDGTHYGRDTRSLWRWTGWLTLKAQL